MKRALVILMVLVMALSFGMANAATVNTWAEPGVELTSIGYFNKVDRIVEGNSTNLNAKDNYGNTYSSMIYADTTEGSIEYRLGGQYKTLEATFYIPAMAVQNGWDHMWDTAVISVYADNEFLGTVSRFSAYDTPLPTIIDVENVQFLRFEFNDVCYFYNGREWGLVAIGDPTLYR